MGDGFQYGDIIFLGFIAIFVVLRLRAMLGRGAQDGSAWKPAARDVVNDKPVVVLKRPPVPAQDDAVENKLLQAHPAAADGLRAIRTADASFSTSEFLHGAKLAFEWILQAFSTADKEKLRALLSADRYQHFAAELDSRAASGLKHETTLVAVLAADITEATLTGGRAQITVQFTSEQMNSTRDKDKKVVEGDPSAIEKVIDIWTFERDVNSRDPNWKITHT